MSNHIITISMRTRPRVTPEDTFDNAIMDYSLPAEGDCQS